MNNLIDLNKVKHEFDTKTPSIFFNVFISYYEPRNSGLIMLRYKVGDSFKINHAVLSNDRKKFYNNKVVIVDGIPYLCRLDNKTLTVEKI